MKKDKMPKIGQKFTSERLGEVTIVKVREFGTIDVVTESGEYFRISGLNFSGVE